MPYDRSTNRWLPPRAADVAVDHENLLKTVLEGEDCNRVVLIHCKCTETIGGSTPATFQLGIEGTPDLFAGTAAFAAAGTSGNSFVVSGTLPVGKKLICTTTAGTGGTPAGGYAIRVLANPVAL